MESIKIAQWAGRHIGYMPLYLAQKRGLFAALGVDATIYGAGNDDAIFKEVESGRADFGVGDPVFAALDYHKNAKVRVVASLIGNLPIWGITHHPQIKPFSHLSDFVGLRIGSFPRPSTTYTLLSALKTRNPRLLKSMEIVEAEIGQQAFLLASGQVDLILELEPTVSATLRQGLHIVCAMSDFYPDFLMTGLMVSSETIDRRPDLVRRVVKGIQQALTLLQTHPEEAVSVGLEMFPFISKEIMAEGVQRMLGSWPAQAVISPQGWANTIKMRQDVGELPSVPPFDAVVDQRFAYEALDLDFTKLS
ncbi:MAG: ABC transporter substrate-binding protein [Bdellovibrionales bacterium]